MDVVGEGRGVEGGRGVCRRVLEMRVKVVCWFVKSVVRNGREDGGMVWEDVRRD